MQTHPADEADRWISQAESDIVGAEAMIDIAHFDLACFLAQQVAEKALKGMLVLAAGERPRTQVVADLLRELRRHGALADAELIDVEILDQYYVATRYPDAPAGALPSTSFKRRQGIEAMALARETLRTARRIVPARVDETGFERMAD